MSSLTLIRKIISPLLFLDVVSRYKGKTALMRIKAAHAYVIGVKKIRTLFLGAVFLVFSFVLLGSGLFLIHSALFVYSQWSAQGKFIAALVLGAVEFGSAIIILVYLLREETWVKFTEIPKVIDSIVDKKVSNKT